jgi:serine/threonine protein kinase/formylglycine-generating enzyme required for sulfatase activity
MKECPACHRCFPDSVNHCSADGDALRFLFAGEPLLDNRYQLERKIGHGGMGMVFKARHVFLKTTHAVKVILPDLVGNDPTLVTRFRQEAMAAAAIRHPHTVSVTDYGIIGGTTPYLVMEYVEGRSLHDLLTQQRRLPTALAIEIALAVCEGVAAAHRAGIVHRDLKPLNILLREGVAPREGLKVLDFGLAKIKSGELLGSFVAAQTQGLMGSPFYMAPEQWGDEDVDVRADIYSLGVILYQMLAGDVPFAGRSIPSIMNKHLTAAPVPLVERGAEVPAEVERVVRRALEKDPSRRQQTVEELMTELREALATLSAQELPPPAGAQTLPLRPQHTGAQPGSRPDSAAGQSRSDEDSIKTIGGPPDRTSALDSEPARTAAGPPVQSQAGEHQTPAGEEPQPSWPPAARRTEEAQAVPAEAPAAPSSSSQTQGAVTSTPQAGHTSPVRRSDEGSRSPITRSDAQQPGLAPPVSFGPPSGEGSTHPPRISETQDLAGREAQRLADEAARRARESDERRRVAEEEAARRHQAEEEMRARRAAAEADERAAGEAVRRPGDDESGALVGLAGAPNGFASGAAGEAGIGELNAAEGAAGGARPIAETERPVALRVPLIAAGAVVILLSLGGLIYLNNRSEPAAEPARSEAAPRTSSPAESGAQTPAALRPEMVALPGGTFRLGRDDVPPLTEPARSARPEYLLWMYQQWPSRPVSIGPFAIDKTEVTNEEYAEFVRQTGHPAPPNSWEGDGGPAERQLRLPVTNVSYEDALAFAAWRSQRDRVTYRLPTEAEWEYAARGGDAARSFPWGGRWIDGHANLGGSAPAPVGSFTRGDTPQGVSDMIGNVWELTSSEAGMYEGNDRTELDPADRGKVVVRGGSYESRPDGDKPLTATSRIWVARDFRSSTLGFRLVRPGT